jgi:hypothetical protein
MYEHADKALKDSLESFQAIEALDRLNLVSLVDLRIDINAGFSAMYDASTRKSIC